MPVHERACTRERAWRSRRYWRCAALCTLRTTLLVRTLRERLLTDGRDQEAADSKSRHQEGHKYRRHGVLREDDEECQQQRRADCDDQRHLSADGAPKNAKVLARKSDERRACVGKRDGEALSRYSTYAHECIRAHAAATAAASRAVRLWRGSPARPPTAAVLPPRWAPCPPSRAPSALRAPDS